MKLYFILLSVFIFISSSSAQKNLIIVDSADNKPIEHVYIYQKNNNTLLLKSISNSRGWLILDTSSIQNFLIISHVSYKKKELPKEFFLHSDTIKLCMRNDSLDQVTVSSFTSNKTREIGYYKSKGKRVLCTNTPGWIIGSIIDIDKEISKFKITRLLCEFEKIDFIKARKSNCKIGVIFYFFEVINNTPTTREVLEPVIFSYDDLKENFNRGIEYSPIIDNVTGQIFIGIEWQTLPCLNSEIQFKQFYLPIIWNDTQNKVWNFNKYTGKWLQSNKSLTTGKSCISIQITYK